MKIADVLVKLEGYGNTQNRKIYRRHGAGDNLYGVSFANLNKMKREIKYDLKLALKLWKTKNIDAQTLATMIIRPSEVSEELIDAWVKEITYHHLIDSFVKNIVYKSPYSDKKMERWIKSDDEWIGRAGWVLMAVYAMKNSTSSDEFFDVFLETIREKTQSALNRKKEAMNNALIAIGLRNETLKVKALKIADEIGVVEVDQGETACQTFNAREYIERAWLRKQKKKSG